MSKTRSRHPRRLSMLRSMLRRRRTLAGILVGMAALAVTMRAAIEDASPVTFSKDVLPILQKNCQGCHRPGEVAPMSLLTYKDARPWAKAIKNAVVSQK